MQQVNELFAQVDDRRKVISQFFVFTGSIVHSPKRWYLSYSEGTSVHSELS